MAEPDLDDLARRMDGAVEMLKSEYAGLRTGRASPSLLEPITAEAYGTEMPMNQLANITAPEPRMLVVSVWDKSSVTPIEKAIRKSGLGLNPQTEGSTIRVPIPELNEERRRELTRVAGKYAEQARISVRNVRRDGIETLRKLEKESEITKDDLKLYSDEIQDLTDQRVSAIDETLASKVQDIMQV